MWNQRGYLLTGIINKIKNKIDLVASNPPKKTVDQPEILDALQKRPFHEF